MKKGAFTGVTNTTAFATMMHDRHAYYLSVARVNDYL